MAFNGLVPELYCTDFNRSLNFYTEILGFKILYETPEDKYAYLERENAQLMLEQLGNGGEWLADKPAYPFGRGMSFKIIVSDIQNLVEKITAHGLEFFLPLEEKWYRKDDTEVGNRQFIVQDPDGFLLRFAYDLGSRPLAAPQP